MRFVDSNVLLYAIPGDPEEVTKSAIANEIIDGGDIGLSVQVLEEFYVQATRSTRSDAIGHAQAAGLVEAWCRFPVQATTVGIMRASLATRDRFGIAYWDAAILESGRALGCSVVLSEDLDDATDYGGIRLENPFRQGRTGDDGRG